MQAQVFDLIVGSDVAYETDHPALLQGVLSKRLAPGGVAILCCPVRFLAVHRELLERLRETFATVGLPCLLIPSLKISALLGALQPGDWAPSSPYQESCCAGDKLSCCER